MDKTILKSNFSKSADTYERFAAVQKICAEKLSFLCPEKDVNSILEIGCGTGVYTSILAGRYPRSRITAVDISPEMVAAARRVRCSDNVEFIATDAENICFEGKFDLITSNASLHWFDDLAGAVGNFARMLSERGSLCFSVYGPATFCELNKVLSACFGERKWLHAGTFAGREDIERMLSAYFEGPEISEGFFGQEYPALLDLMKAVKFTGTRGPGLSPRIFLGKRRLEELEKLYFGLYGGIRVTHHVLFVRARI